MTGAQLKSARERMGASQRELAMQMRVELRTVQRWEAGDRKIPAMAARLLELLPREPFRQK